MNIPEMTQADLAEIAFNLGVVLAADAHKVLMHAIAARDAQWNALIAGQAGEAVADDSFEFEAPGLRSFGMKVPSPMEYGKKCYERGVLAGKAQALASLPAPQVAQPDTTEQAEAPSEPDYDALEREHMGDFEKKTGIYATQPTASDAGEREIHSNRDAYNAGYEDALQTAGVSVLVGHHHTPAALASNAGERGLLEDALTGLEYAKKNLPWGYTGIDRPIERLCAALASKPPAGEQKPQAEYLDKLIDRLKLPPESMTAKQHIELCDEAAAMLHLLKKNSHPEPVAPPAREALTDERVFSLIDKACAEFRRSQRGVRGNMLTPSDDPSYVLVRVVEAALSATPPAQAVQDRKGGV